MFLVIITLMGRPHTNILHFYFHMRKSISIPFGKHKPHGLPERTNKLRSNHFSRRVERRSRIGMVLHTEPRRIKTALITKFPLFCPFQAWATHENNFLYFVF